jgi:hypothetical protein
MADDWDVVRPLEKAKKAMRLRIQEVVRNHAPWAAKSSVVAETGTWMRGLGMLHLVELRPQDGKRSNALGIYPKYRYLEVGRRRVTGV